MWLPRLSAMTISPGLSVGVRHWPTQAVNVSPVIGPSSTKGAMIRSWRSPARKSEARPEICPADRFQRRTGGAPDRVFQCP